MANELLRTSIHAAGLTVQELSEKIQVDPKTIERWITKSRLPHRANRQQVALALNQDEATLWPDAFVATDAATRPEGEPNPIYPSRGSVPASTWVSLIENAHESIDILAFAASFLNDAVPNFINLLQERAEAGVHIRLLFGDPHSQAVAIRGKEEGIGESLADRCRLTWKYIADLDQIHGIDMRQHSCTLYASLFRFDEDLLVNNHIFGMAASQNPILHLKNTPGSDLSQRYLTSFEFVWHQAKQIGQEK